MFLFSAIDVSGLIAIICFCLLIMRWKIFVLTFCTSWARKRYNLIIMEESSSVDQYSISNTSSKKNHKIKQPDYSSIIRILSSEDSLVQRNSLGLTLDLTEKSARKLKKHKKVLHIEEDTIVKVQFDENLESIYSQYPNKEYNSSMFKNKPSLSKKQIVLRKNFYKPKRYRWEDWWETKEELIHKKNLYNTSKSFPLDTISLLFNFYPINSWALKKISGNSSGYEYIEEGGRNVTVYVLDTGVDVFNPEFEDRAYFGYNAIENSPNTDQQGHGTHVAGIIASKTFGISKKANIVAVKVLDENGTGSVSKIIEGIEFVVKDFVRNILKHGCKNTENTEDLIFYNNFHSQSERNRNFEKSNVYLHSDPNQISNTKAKNHLRIQNKGNAMYNAYSETSNTYLPKDTKKIFESCTDSYYNRKKAVVNLSVGGTKSLVLNYFIKKISQRFNIFFSVAAGNERSNACSFSPSSSEYSMTVAAVDKNDLPAKFSNKGRCVDIYAPGVEIESLWLNNTTKVLSGTSMSTPFVTGVAAVYLSLADFEFSDLKEKIIEDADVVIKDSTNIKFWSKKQPSCSLKKLYKRIKENVL